MTSTMFEEYVKMFNQYTSKYGNKVAVLMQCGDFYEVYGLGIEGIGNVNLIADDLSLTITRQRKESPSSRTNYERAGFPLGSLEKYRGKLIDLGYQVVIADQQTGQGGLKIRVVSEVVSQATEMNTSRIRNWVVCVCFAKDRIGVAGIDVSIGSVWVDEFVNRREDKGWTRDELVRVLQSYYPREIIVIEEDLVGGPGEESVKFVSDALNGEVNIIPVGWGTYQKASLQNELIGHVWSSVVMSPIEFLDLEYSQIATAALCDLIKYIGEHNQTLLTKLSKPMRPNGVSRLWLPQNAAQQLNLWGGGDDSVSDKARISRRLRSVYDVISTFIQTPMGLRDAHESLIYPSVLVDRIESVQRESSWMNLESARFIHKSLSGMRDVSKLRRRLEAGKLTPPEAINLWNVLGESVQIMRGIEWPSELKAPERIEEMLAWQQLNPDVCAKWKKFGNGEFEDGIEYENIFIRGAVAPLDTCSDELRKCEEWINKYCQILNGEFGVGVFKPLIQEGCIYCTPARWKKVNEVIKGSAKISNPELAECLGELELRESSVKAQVHVSSGRIVQASRYWREQAAQLAILNRQYWNEWCRVALEQWGAILIEIEGWLSKIDLAQAKARLIQEYGYNWPQLVEGESSVKFEGLRHALIERIDLEHQYVTHNFSLGGETCGLMLYGLNGTGKSSVMKACGIAVVLAQSGWPVPVSRMELAPFKAILTRILGQDNIFRGRSTFETEMCELKSILDRHNESTLVLGDELCHGTESDSGMALIISTVVRLAKRRSKFLMATHNHPVATHPLILGLGNVKVCHLSSSLGEGGEIIYDRILREGAGNPLYGIEVAEALGLSEDVIDLAYQIRAGGAPKARESRYNSQKLIDICEICQEAPAVETHHISPQKDGSGHEGLFIHQQSNLVGICEKCHKDIHKVEGGAEIKRVALANGESKVIIV